jgi:uncharacterized membrane protein
VIGVLLHPFAVHFPLALWLTSTLFDLLAWRRGDPVYRRMAYWLVGLGLLGALASIVSGWIDLVDQERQGVGPGLLARHRLHSGVAYTATVAYAVNLGWRFRSQNRFAGALLVLSLVGAILIAIAGYLGGDLRTVM